MEGQMARKTYRIANGWNRKSENGLTLCEIGPSDFDANYDITAEATAAGCAPPYRREGSYYVFDRKRDFEAAVEELERNGYIA
jgi:hypothetical protein